jgi:hypothetical protein
MTQTTSTAPTRTQPSSPAAWRRAVTFTLTVGYTEHVLPTTRSRRSVARAATLERAFCVALTDPANAPIVMMIREGRDCRAYRLHRGALYRELRSADYPHHDRPVPFTLEALIESTAHLARSYGALEGVVRRVEDRLERVLCVGTRLYERTGEPLFSVERGRLEIVHQTPAQPAVWQGLYNLLEREDAVRATRRRRSDRGDPFPSVHVFDAGAITQPGHNQWLERYREAQVVDAVARLEGGVRGLRRPERVRVLERLLRAA